MITLDLEQVLSLKGYAARGAVALTTRTIELPVGDPGLLAHWGWVRLV